MSWVDCGPMGLRNELPAGIRATVGRRARGSVAWQLTHPDAPRTVTRGMAATVALAKAAAIDAAPAYALTLADALDARAAVLTSRAASIRGAALEVLA